MAVAALMTPASLMAFVLAVWAVAAEMDAASSFAISSGLFSHWQVWMVTALGLQGLGCLINRRVRAA